MHEVRLGSGYIAVLTDQEIIGMLRHNMELYKTALRRGKGVRRCQATEQREPKLKKEVIK